MQQQIPIPHRLGSSTEYMHHVHQGEEGRRRLEGSISQPEVGWLQHLEVTLYLEYGDPLRIRSRVVQQELLSLGCLLILWR